MDLLPILPHKKKLSLLTFCSSPASFHNTRFANHITNKMPRSRNNRQRSLALRPGTASHQAFFGHEDSIQGTFEEGSIVVVDLGHRRNRLHPSDSSISSDGSIDSVASWSFFFTHIQTKQRNQQTNKHVWTTSVWTANQTTRVEFPNIREPIGSMIRQSTRCLLLRMCGENIPLLPVHEDHVRLPYSFCFDIFGQNTTQWKRVCYIQTLYYVIGFAILGSTPYIWSIAS